GGRRSVVWRSGVGAREGRRTRAVRFPRLVRVIRAGSSAMRDKRPTRPVKLAAGPRTVLLVAGAALAWPAVAGAHAGGNAFILLLPTPFYIAGGALAGAASFVVITAVPARLFARLQTLSLQWNVEGLRRDDRVAIGASLLSFAALVLLVATGLLGSRDPLANPLPLFVWTVWWIGFTYLN